MKAFHKIAKVAARLFIVFVLCGGISLCATVGAVAGGCFENAYAADKATYDEDAGKPRDAADSSDGQKHYTDANPLISTDENGNLKAGFSTSNVITGVIAPLINGVAVPVAILLVAWRSIYIAIFPMLARIDPLDMLSTARYSGQGMKSGGSRNMGGTRGGKPSQDDATKAFKQEFKGTVIGLVVVGAVWGFIQIAMWVAVMLLGYGDQTYITDSQEGWLLLLPFMLWAKVRLVGNKPDTTDCSYATGE